LTERNYELGRASCLAVITGALGAGLAGQAHAVVYTFTGANSTSAAAGLPVTLSTTTPSSLNVDLNHDGITDFTLSSNSTGIFVNGGSNQSNTFVNYAAATTPGTAIDTTSLKLESGSIPIAEFTGANTAKTDFTSGTPALIVDEFTAGPNTYLGYIEGTYTGTGLTAGASNPSLSFAVTDFGYDPTPVPVVEPASLALLASGVGGLIAFRKRRKAARA